MTMKYITRFIIALAINAVSLAFVSTATLAENVGAEQGQRTPIATGDKPVQIAPVKIGADPAELDNSDGVVDVLVGLWNRVFADDSRQSIITNTLNLEHMNKQRRDHVKEGRVTGLPVPRFVSLGNNANLRTGPGERYPSQWLLRTRHQPLEIMGEYKKWRQVRDMDGAKGWVYAPILKSKRYFSVTVDETALYKEKKYESPIKVRLGKGVILKPETCDQYWCLVETINVEENYQGWIRRAHIWGIYQNESLD